MSTDPVRARYAEVRYPGDAFPRTHPARTAAVARLLGLAPPEPRTARILEIGCGQGHNLLPFAAQLPDARFVGLDFAPAEIAHGRAIAAAVKLSNIDFVCGDLRTYAPEPGSFDYIIAHGVLSWIPDDAKDALFALCAGALAPQGVAYISYNLYPGWKQREVLRDLVDLMGGVAPTPTDRLTAAERTLATLDRLIAGRTEPHAELHRALIAESRRKHPAGLYHDELGSINDPCYFLQFAAWAAKHGLDYLGEAEWYAMFPELVGASARSVLAEFAHDRLRLEQLLDFIRNRSFRCSLLTPAPFVARHPDPAVLRTCRIGSSLRPQVGVPILQAGVRVRFGGQSPLAFASDEPVTKAVFSILADAWPRRLPFAEVLTATARLLTAVGLDRPADLENQLLARLLDACGWCRADFMTDIPIECALRPDATPKVHPLVRLMAGQDLPVVNAWHEPIPLDAAARSLLASLDGTRTEFSAAEQSQLQHFAASALLMP